MAIYYLPYRRWWEVMFFARMGRLYRSVCEQLSGANSSLIVTKLGQPFPWSQGTRWLNFGRSRSKVKVGGEGMRSTERTSSSTLHSQWVLIFDTTVTNLCHLFAKVIFNNSWRKKPNVELANPSSPVKLPIKWRRRRLRVTVSLMTEQQNKYFSSTNVYPSLTFLSFNIFP